MRPAGAPGPPGATRPAHGGWGPALFRFPRPPVDSCPRADARAGRSGRSLPFAAEGVVTFTQLLGLLRSNIEGTKQSAVALVEAILRVLPVEGSPNQADANETARIADLLQEIRGGLGKIEFGLRTYERGGEGASVEGFWQVLNHLRLEVKLLAPHLVRFVEPQGAYKSPAPVPQVRLTTFLYAVNEAVRALDRADPLALVRGHLAELRGGAPDERAGRIWTDSATKTVWLDGQAHKIDHLITFRLVAAPIKSHNEGRTPLRRRDLAEAGGPPRQEPPPRPLLGQVRASGDSRHHR